MADDLTRFLLARITEDEERAAKATPGRWKLWTMDVLADKDGTGDYYTASPVARTWGQVDGKPRTFDATHIARWDPARVMLECEAKRRVIERLCDIAWTGSYAVRDVILGELASPYADHPDYRPEWRP